MKQFLKTAFVMLFVIIAFPVQAQNFIPEHQERPEDSRPALDFVIDTNETNVADLEFRNAQNQVRSFKDYKGSWVLINLWATWCPPCVYELKTFEAMDFKVPDSDFKVFALSLDQQRDGQQLKDFLEEIDIYELPFGYEHTRNTQRRLGFRGLPTTYLVSPDSKVFAYYEGVADWSHGDTINQIKNLISLHTAEQQKESVSHNE